MHAAFKIFAVVAVVVGLVTIPIMFIGIEMNKEKQEVPVHKSDWTYLGNASDGTYGGSVLKRTDPDTGATIYVLLGRDRGGIFVLPAEKDKK